MSLSCRSTALEVRMTEIRSFQCHYHADPQYKSILFWKVFCKYYFILYFQNTLIRAFYFVFSKYFLGVFCTSLCERQRVQLPQMWSWRLMSLADMVSSRPLSTVTLQASGSGSRWKPSSTQSMSRDSTDVDDELSELEAYNSSKRQLHQVMNNENLYLPITVDNSVKYIQ